MIIVFDVLGSPSPQGSHRAFIAGGKARIRDMGSTKSVAWRDSVSLKAKELAEEHGCLDGPLTLAVLFRFPMPASRSKAERNAGVIWKTTAPDSSKLLRALEDGLQAGGLLRDDARIVEHVIRKVEILNSWTGATVSIGRINRVPSISMDMPVEHELFGQPA